MLVARVPDGAGAQPPQRRLDAFAQGADVDVALLEQRVDALLRVRAKDDAIAVEELELHSYAGLMRTSTICASAGRLSRSVTSSRTCSCSSAPP